VFDWDPAVPMSNGAPRRPGRPGTGKHVGRGKGTVEPHLGPRGSDSRLSR